MSSPFARHSALIARILTAGVSAAAALGIVAWLARDSQEATPDGAPRLVEVRIGAGVDDDEARRALEAWLEGSPDVTTGAGLAVVDLPADTVSEPS